MIEFFFSSRRRHTRCGRDWSSDVCSSDLTDGPCRMIIPHLNRLYGRYRGEGLVVIGISVDSSPADVVAFTKTIPLNYPVGMMNPEIVRLLGAPDAVPTSYLVDRTGRLRRTFVGFVAPETIEREVRKYLEGP